MKKILIAVLLLTLSLCLVSSSSCKSHDDTPSVTSSGESSTANSLTYNSGDWETPRIPI